MGKSTKTPKAPRQEAAGTQAPEHEGGEPIPTDGLVFDLPEDVGVVDVLSGEVREHVLGVCAARLPEAARPGYLARFAAENPAGDGPIAVSVVDAVTVLAEVACEAAVVEMTHRAAAEAEVEREKALREKALRQEAAGTASGTGSLSEVLVAAVRERVGVVEPVTAEDRERAADAGLDGLSVEDLLGVIESIGDPVADLGVKRGRLDELAIELGTAIKEAKRVLAEAIEAHGGWHAEVHRYDLERARHCRVRIAAIQEAERKLAESRDADRRKAEIEARIKAQ